MRFKRITVAVTVAVVAAALAPAPSPAAEPGIRNRTIKVGVHAPATGAVPLPQESIERGARVYWKWRRLIGRPINGRHVEVVVRNDNYNPTTSRQECRAMIEKERVAFLFGFFAGPNEVLTCAQTAARHHIPYLSMGTARLGVRKLWRYLSLSATWARQARLMADHLVTDLKARRDANGAVYYDNPTFAPAGNAFTGTMRRLGADIDYERKTSKGSTATEAQLIVQELKLQGIENVFVHVSPIFFMQLLQQARSQQYRPRWVGVGNIAGNDPIVRVGCRNGTLRRNRFVSPMPAFGDRGRFDGNYGRAMKRIYGDPGDHVTWLGWAAAKATARLLESAGRKLTLDGFIRTAERSRRVKTGILPLISFRKNDHFGGRGVHVLRARCRDERWHTIRTFEKGF